MDRPQPTGEPKGRVDFAARERAWVLVAHGHEAHDEVGLLGDEVVVPGYVQSVVHEPRFHFSPGRNSARVWRASARCDPPLGGFLASTRVWNGDIVATRQWR